MRQASSLRESVVFWRVCGEPETELRHLVKILGPLELPRYMQCNRIIQRKKMILLVMPKVNTYIY